MEPDDIMLMSTSIYRMPWNFKELLLAIGVRFEN